ncbi:MAG: DNA integrity scanning protein DisA nucleotide-binding domain protein [Candidatus Syntropharchaeia archaeon]
MTLGKLCTKERKCNPETLRKAIELAIEIAREGREGRRIGTIFVVGDEDKVLSMSKPLILDPLEGHPLERKKLSDPNVQETIKELSKLDGAFVVSDDGHVLSAARYIDATSKEIDLPMGFGSRHMAAASISKQTDAVAIVVSESGVVRVFDDGELVGEIFPELWLLSRATPHIKGAYETFTEDDLGVIAKK